MKRRLLTVLSLAFLVFAVSATAAAPIQVDIQCKILVSDIPLTGSGYFKFALASWSDHTNFWANDSTASGEPTAWITSAVYNGVASIALGEEPAMDPIDPDIFGLDTNLYLRIWFSDDTTTFNEMLPKQQLLSAPFAIEAYQVGGMTRMEIVAAATNGVTLSGDISGTPGGGTTVDSLQGDALNTGTPSSDEVILWDGSAWTSAPVTSVTDDLYVDETGDTMTGVLTINSSRGLSVSSSSNEIEIGSAANGANRGVAVGAGANAYSFGTAVGRNADGTSVGVAIGDAANGDTYGSALGYSATGANYSVGIGYNASADNGSVAIGPAANGGSGGAVAGNQGVAVGRGTDGSAFGTAVGLSANGNRDGVGLGAYADGNNYGVAIGLSANGYDYSVGIGYSAGADDGGVAIGPAANGGPGGAVAYNEGIAIGRGANGNDTNVAMGVSANSQGGSERISIGHNVVNSVDESARIRGTFYMDGGTGIVSRPVFGSGLWKTLVPLPPLENAVFVATNGTPAGPGTVDRPFDTPSNAYKMAAFQYTNAPAAVVIAAGNYPGLVMSAPNIHLLGFSRPQLDDIQVVGFSGNILGMRRVENIVFSGPAIVQTDTESVKFHNCRFQSGLAIYGSKVNVQDCFATGTGLIDGNAIAIGNGIPISEISIYNSSFFDNDNANATMLVESNVFYFEVIGCEIVNYGQGGPPWAAIEDREGTPLTPPWSPGQVPHLYSHNVIHGAEHGTVFPPFIPGSGSGAPAVYDPSSTTGTICFVQNAVWGDVGMSNEQFYANNIVYGDINNKGGAVGWIQLGTGVGIDTSGNTEHQGMFPGGMGSQRGFPAAWQD